MNGTNASMAALGLLLCVACDKPGAGAEDTGKTGGDGGSEAASCDSPPEGQYGNCIASGSADQIDLGACGSNDATCLVDSPQLPSAGVCAYGCEADCECPPAGEADVVCGEIVAGQDKSCYIDCSMGQLCPNGMFCWGGYLCAFPINDGGTPYGDCINAAAEEACGTSQQCLLDDQAAPTFGVCARLGCEDVSQCAAPPATGNAVLSCAPVLYSPHDACYLSCANGETCPDGMVCFESTVCAWQAGMPAPGGDGGSTGG